MPNIQEQFDGGVLSYNDITQCSVDFLAYNTNLNYTTLETYTQATHRNARRALNKLSAICIEFGKAKRKGEV